MNIAYSGMRGVFRRIRLPLFVLAAGVVLGWPGSGMAEGMNGPPATKLSRQPSEAQRRPIAAQPLLASIRFFQHYISPTDGARCQFSPTCSAYGHQAIRTQGPWLGLLMTADRLMRCNDWTEPGVYRTLPDGRLADPVTDHSWGG